MNCLMTLPGRHNPLLLELPWSRPVQANHQLQHQTDLVRQFLELISQYQIRISGNGISDQQEFRSQNSLWDLVQKEYLLSSKEEAVTLHQELTPLVQVFVPVQRL
jgi:hypothetical protein